MRKIVSEMCNLDTFNMQYLPSTLHKTEYAPPGTAETCCSIPALFPVVPSVDVFLPVSFALAAASLGIHPQDERCACPTHAHHEKQHDLKE